MQSPYADIHAAAARSALRMPRLDCDRVRADPTSSPSDAAQRARDARLAASIVASVAFRGTVALHRDYVAVTGAAFQRGDSFTTRR